jgi:hypothetical protein
VAQRFLFLVAERRAREVEKVLAGDAHAERGRGAYRAYTDVLKIFETMNEERKKPNASTG